MTSQQLWTIFLFIVIVTWSREISRLTAYSQFPNCRHCLL